LYIIILGAGEVGYNLAKLLSYEKHDIVVIEPNLERVKRAREKLDIQVFEGTGSSPNDLKEAGVEKADMVVAVSNNDEVNLLACLIAGKFNVKTKIARVKNREFTREDCALNARFLGIDLIIHPDSEVAKAVVGLLNMTAATDILEFADGKILLLGIQLDKKCGILGQSLAEVGRSVENVTFRTVAIQRRDRTIIPRGADIFMNNDRVYVMTQRENLPELLILTGKENVKMENVMILGGGQTGTEIASQLEDDVNVKIIESNVDKTEVLADRLQKSLVIRGDGRDINLLALEGIIDMDAFISVTGDDETNIISCLVAKHLRVPRIISLINKTDYTPIIPTIGIDAYVSKQIVTVDQILKFIRSGSIVSVASIPGQAAEILEYVAQDNSKILRKPLNGIHFPKGALLGAVVRRDEFFIPVGNSQIKAGDKVVVFALPTAIKEVEKLFN
jgi:trk system potassium uptake protein TrkA